MNRIDLSLVAVARKALDRGDVHGALKALDDFIKDRPELQEKTMEQQCSDALSVLSRDYQNDVNGIAEDIVSRWKSGDFDGDRDAVIEAIEQDCDGSQRVIYTKEAILGLLFSSHDEAYTEISGDLPMSGGAINWSALAYMAFVEDVKDDIQHDGIDLNEAPPKENTVQCPGCDEYKDKETADKDFTCEDCMVEAGNARCDKCKKWFTEGTVKEEECEACHANDRPRGTAEHPAERRD